MKAVVAASQHWMDSESIRECLVKLPVMSTVVVSDRPGGDSLVAKIALEELAMHVEKFEVIENDSADFRQKVIDELNNEADSAFFFCQSDSEVEYFVSKYARNQRVQTEVILKSFGS